MLLVAEQQFLFHLYRQHKGNYLHKKGYFQFVHLPEKVLKHCSLHTSYLKEKCYSYGTFPQKATFKKKQQGQRDGNSRSVEAFLVQSSGCKKIKWKDVTAVCANPSNNRGGRFT